MMDRDQFAEVAFVVASLTIAVCIVVIAMVRYIH